LRASLFSDLLSYTFSIQNYRLVPSDWNGEACHSLRWRFPKRFYVFDNTFCVIFHFRYRQARVIRCYATNGHSLAFVASCQKNSPRCYICQFLYCTLVPDTCNVGKIWKIQKYEFLCYGKYLITLHISSRNIPVVMS